MISKDIGLTCDAILGKIIFKSKYLIEKMKKKGFILKTLSIFAIIKRAKLFCFVSYGTKFFKLPNHIYY